MRRLTVLSVAYALAPIGRDAVGGAEQIVSALDEALTEAGHRSIVVACRGSDVAGVLACTGAEPSDACDETGRENAERATRDAISRVLASEHVDIVHMHGLDFPRTLPDVDVPVLATLHLPPDWYGTIPRRANLRLHAVSNAHHAACLACPGLQGQHLLPPIPNGVPVERLAITHHAKRGFAVMLGRICEEKGQHIALQAARKADFPLILGGQVFPYPEHRAYFETKIAPLLDRHRRYVGALDFARKRRYLSAARCVLIPSMAAETSSLVAMEAMACGTPVIAFPSGALPEIIDHGRTGFLVDDEDSLASSVERAANIDPSDCRADARTRFQSARMTDAYLGRYRALAEAAGRRAA